MGACTLFVHVLDTSFRPCTNCCPVVGGWAPAVEDRLIVNPFASGVTESLLASVVAALPLGTA